MPPSDVNTKVLKKSTIELPIADKNDVIASVMVEITSVTIYGHPLF